MSIEMLFAFITASIILLAIPGPTILTVISYSISHGNRAKLPLIGAVALGDSTALFLSLVGLGVVLAKSAFLFQIIKIVGGLYLLYLGYKLLKAGIKGDELSFEKKPVSKKKLFMNTYLVTALNPKGIIFFVSFLPQFINPNENVQYQLWTLAITFVILATLNASLYAIFASKAKEYLTSAKSQKRFNIAGGTLLSIAGIWALNAKHTS